MASADLDGRKLVTREGFHRTCREAFGFPEFYGNNLSAWIDCMSGLRDDDGMSRFVLGPDEVLHIVVSHAGVLKKSAPEVLKLLEQGVEEVNLRCEEAGQLPMLALDLR
ncbi:barstar family protein [Lacisediminimonas profundi]|uniref:barstar family protein n=1 Tax=Lacisediminimonas profundi TaxID=2603856 RepID=UPI00124BBEAF|nr:barstar family protein [Lacisediminimonas profundi]